MTLALGTIVSRDGKWFLVFSDGREEGPFSSKEAAQKREKVVSYFKHRSKNAKTSKAQYQKMADLGVIAEYRIEDTGEVVFAVFSEEDEGYVEAFVVLGDKIDPLSYGESELKDGILDLIFEEAEGEIQEMESFGLSEAVIEGQMISGGHAHTAELDMNRDGSTSEDAGHKHYVYNGYVGSAYVEINGIRVSHTHLLVVKPN